MLKFEPEHVRDLRRLLNPEQDYFYKDSKELSSKIVHDSMFSKKKLPIRIT